MLSRLGLPAFTAASAIFTTSRYFASTGSGNIPMSSSSSYSVRKRTDGLPAVWPYRPSDFQRMDETDDARFYGMPRFVTHIDDRCIDALSSYYESVLPQPSTTPETPKPRILDIASSWISHLPKTWNTTNAEIVGVGMNESELSKNPALSRYLVLDLNNNPDGLSKALQAEEKYDAAICSVSIDYLVKPREMLADLAKLLKKDAGVHLSFSNRCFPSKVVGRWLRVEEFERCNMVADYFHFAGTSTTGGDKVIEPGQLYHSVEIVTVLAPSRSGDPLYVVRAQKA